jgi:hypothetical protein
MTAAIVEPKKRGRKPKQELPAVAAAEVVEELENIVLMSGNDTEDSSLKVPKKRGRKPKGGKIVQQIVALHNDKEDKPNVILHLKCSMKDLQEKDRVSSVQKIESFDFFTNKQDFEIVSSDIKQQHNVKTHDVLEECNDKSTKEDIKEIWRKLKQLEHSLHTNSMCDKKAACFWCTYEFDNPPVYIPKHHVKDSYHVYGCFCSPECATAYLMEESIDSSSKFERYHFINHIYSKIYDYTKNIKPAPNPYYMLDKYYGNLTIQEYRSLLRNDRLFLVVDKPLTRVLPELHEDNDDFIINNKIIPSNTYQIKKKKQQTKNAIVCETFGMN